MEEYLLSPLGNGRPASQSSPWRSKGQLSAGTCLGCFCGAFLAATTAALFLFAIKGAAKRDEKNGTGTRFCCSNEAGRLFAVIDKTKQPCSDFFAYICKNAINHGFVQQDVANDMLASLIEPYYSMAIARPPHFCLGRPPRPDCATGCPIRIFDTDYFPDAFALQNSPGTPRWRGPCRDNHRAYRPGERVLGTLSSVEREYRTPESSPGRQAARTLRSLAG
ncbi:uncharacterized protein LOC144103533 [Amblyomma americanum]